MAVSPQRILLAGATGYIGRALASELIARGHDVVAVVRSAARIPGADVRVAPVTDASALSAALAGRTFDTVISCIASTSGVPNDAWRVDCQANQNLLRVARDTGANRFLLLSAICVQKPKLAFQFAKLAFEAELRESGMDYTIVRPTAFFKSLSGQIGRVSRGKPFLVFGSGEETACKPIGEADLATFMADSLSNPAARNRTLPIGGPGPAITPRQQGTLLFGLVGRPPAFRSVSPQMFKVAANVLSPLGKVWPAAARKAELAKIGHYYATESMLIWDDDLKRYDANATPETGSRTLERFYRDALENGLEGQSLGDHKVF